MTNVGIGPFLYLPVEVAAREFESKVLLALFAVERGFEAVVGQKRLMMRNLRHMPPGIVLFKTLTVRDGRAMEHARRHGHAVAAIDEEMFGLIAHEEELRWVSEQAVERCQRLLALSDDHAAMLQARYPESRRKISVVGNPRIDLLRPELRGCYQAEVAEIRAKYAPFILINTNFALMNSLRKSPQATIRSLYRSGTLDRNDAEDQFVINEFCRIEQGNIELVKRLLTILPQRFPKHRVVLRPHPVERIETWTRFTEKMPAVSVVRTGAALQWILAADAMLHSGCTTGTEAFALGRPAVNLQPVSSRVLDRYLSGKVNFSAADAEAAVRQLEPLLAAGLDFRYPAPLEAVFDGQVAGRTGAFAAQRISDALADNFPVSLHAKGGTARWQPRSGYGWRVRRKPHHVSLVPDTTVEAVVAKLRGYMDQLQMGDTPRVRSCGQILFHIHGCANELPIAEPMSWPRRVLHWLQTPAGQTGFAEGR